MGAKIILSKDKGSFKIEFFDGSNSDYFFTKVSGFTSINKYLLAEKITTQEAELFRNHIIAMDTIVWHEPDIEIPEEKLLSREIKNFAATIIAAMIFGENKYEPGARVYIELLSNDSEKLIVIHTKYGKTFRKINTKQIAMFSIDFIKGYGFISHEEHRSLKKEIEKIWEHN